MAAATSRAMRPSNGSSHEFEQRVDCRANLSVGLVPLVEPLRSGCRHGRGRRTQGRHDLGWVLVDGQRRTAVGVRHELVRVDDEQPVGVSDQFLDTARCRRRADLDDEIGMLALPECRVGRQQRPGGQRAASGRVRCTAQAGEWFRKQRPPSCSTQLDDALGRDSQTSRYHHDAVAGTHLTQKRGQLVVPSMRIGVRLRRALASDRFDIAAGWQQRFPKWQVQVHRTGRHADRMLYSLHPGGHPTDPLVRCHHRHAGVMKPLDETTEEVLLVDRLVGADTVQLGRPVGRHHDDRHACHRRFDDGGKVIRRRGSRRAEHCDRFSGRCRDPKSKERRRALVDMHMQRDPWMTSGCERDRRRA